MQLASSLFIFTALLFMAVLLEPIARRLRLPFPAVLLATGFAAAELLIAFGVDTGLRWQHFHDLVFYVFLPVLIFASAFSIDVRELGRNALPVLFLAMPLMALSAAT